MSYATRRPRREKLAAEPAVYHGSGMSTGWWVASLGLGALVALMVAANAKDVARYIKISSM